MKVYDYSQYNDYINPERISKEMTIKQLVQWYHRGCSLSENSKKASVSLAEKYIFPELGDVKATDLTCLDFELMLGKLHESTSESRRSAIATLLHESLKVAHFYNIVSNNCLDDYRHPKQGMKILNPLKKSEISHMFSLLDGSPYRYLIYFLTLMPIKIYETFNLRYENWNTENETLYIDNRSIPLPKTITRILQSQQKLQNKLKEKNSDTWLNSDNFIFTKENGMKMASVDILHLLHSVSKKMNLPFKLNCLYLHETAVTLLLDSGTDIKTVQYIINSKSERGYLRRINKVGTIHTKEDITGKYNTHIENKIRTSKELEYQCIKKYLNIQP